MGSLRRDHVAALIFPLRRKGAHPAANSNSSISQIPTESENICLIDSAVFSQPVSGLARLGSQLPQSVAECHASILLLENILG